MVHFPEKEEAKGKHITFSRITKT